MNRSSWIVTGSLLLVPSVTLAQPSDPPADLVGDIGFPSVAAAREAISARPGIATSSHDQWTVFADNAANAMWLFTPDGSSAPPIAVRLTFDDTFGRLRIDQALRCEAPVATCRPFVNDLDIFRLEMKVAANPRNKSGPDTYAPAADEPAAARRAIDSYLAALDAGRFDDAYARLDPRRRAAMSLDEFGRGEAAIRAAFGANARRENWRTGWYRDPSGAPGGVYAAFDYECRYAGTAVCGETIIARRQDDGSFAVFRHDREFIDAETLQRWREKSR